MAPAAPSGPVAASRAGKKPALIAKVEGKTGTMEPERDPVRIKNAKQIRSDFREILASPDGLDPEPLTVPKCVECKNCGWPVFVRDSKVATSKTYARAGILRGGHKQKAEKTDGEDGEEGETTGIDDDAGSNDSRDTIERLEDDLEETKDKLAEAESTIRDLQTQVQGLTEELAETCALLEAAEERIEVLEKAEERWREKNSQLRIRNEGLLLIIERRTLEKEDLEIALKTTITELRELRKKYALFMRRRKLMLEAMQERWGVMNDMDTKGTVARFWQFGAVNNRYERMCAGIESRRQREGKELQMVVKTERLRADTAEALVAGLQARLKEAAHRFLDRALSAFAWPWAKGHAFHAWSTVHPAVTLENRLNETTEKLRVTSQKLKESEEFGKRTFDELQVTKARRDWLEAELKRVQEALDAALAELGDTSKMDALMAKLEAERKAKEAKQKRIEELLALIEQMERDFDEEREDYEVRIAELEAKLNAAERAAAAGKNAGDGGGVPDELRVVPRGTGVLCVGCLKQIVQRGVSPLPPIAAAKEPVSKLQKAKRMFFSKELKGQVDPDDPLHHAAFKGAKDPYGVARLALLPTKGSYDNLKSPRKTPPPSPKPTVWPRISSPSSTPALLKDLPGAKDKARRVGGGFRAPFR